MPENPYFREHVEFLLRGGPAMAAAYPRVAEALGRPGSDPDVERLLEGVAFIASKISERQAVSLHETCQLLVEIMFPHYLSPLPSATIVEMSQPPDEERRVVPRGAEVLSIPVLGTACRFSTAHDVALDGLVLEDVQWEPRGADTILTLSFDAQHWLEQPPYRDAIRLHLRGEPLLTRSLYHWLLARVASIEVLDRQGQALAVLDDRPRAVGFADDEALMWHPPGTFAGYRLLQEYFMLPQRFMFVDLPGVWEPVREARADRFAVRIALKATGDALSVTDHHLRLGCTPVVNLFEHTADPIKRVAGRSDYRVRPAGPHLHYEISRVVDVSGYTRRGTVAYPLLPELDLQLSGGSFAQLYRRLYEGDVQTYVFAHDAEALLPTEQTLMVDLVASNGRLPKALGAGDIHELAAPAGPVTCYNLLPPSTPAAPPLGEDLRRRLVNHMALAQRDPHSLQALREVVDLYNFFASAGRQATRAHGLLVDSLLEATTEEVMQRHHGAPVWGRATLLTVDDNGFESEGELFLFGSIINELIARQTTINVFSRFAVRRAQTQDVYRWPTRIGRHLLSEY